MAAYLPKSSTENERSAVVITTKNGVDVLARQIAGALARRIVTYAKVGEKCHVDEQMGFIKFGSRVDVYLPVGTEVLIEMDQKVTGNQTPIARLSKCPCENSNPENIRKNEYKKAYPQYNHLSESCIRMHRHCDGFAG